jgi:DNA-binding CsgD family transcriptional regulator
MLRQEEAYRKLQSDFDAASQHSKQALQQRTMALYNSKQENKLECIIQEFTAAYPGALERMQIEHPELIEAERHIVVLSFLGFRVKEEAELLGLSTNTVTKYRTNIRKKTNYNSVLSLSYQT